MNYIILGCGRSGTSLLSSLFGQAGFELGAKLHPPRHSNPPGFFESGEVNQINNLLLEGHPSRNGLSGWVGEYERPVEELAADVRPRVEALVARQPFCFKDPRFSFTLPAWADSLGAFSALFVFRHPAWVVASMLKECSAYYPQYGLTAPMAERIWCAHALSLFEFLQPRYRVLCVAYEDLLDGIGVRALGARLGLELDQRLVQKTLNRSKPVGRAAEGRALDSRTLEIFARLRELRV